MASSAFYSTGKAFSNEKSVSIIFSRLSHNTGCTEVLLNSFGPDGTVADLLPNDSWWYELIYATIINLLSLIICIFGAKQFGNVTALVMIVVLLSCLTTLVSFIPNRWVVARKALLLWTRISWKSSKFLDKLSPLLTLKSIEFLKSALSRKI